MTEANSNIRTFLISHRYRFVCPLIAKNASSSLRSVFAAPRFESQECRFDEVDARIMAEYRTFGFFRHPVSRLLSAYSEISFRISRGEMNGDRLRFWHLDDKIARFAAFTDEIGQLRADPHILSQKEWIEGIRIDCFATVERFQNDVALIYKWLDLGPCPEFPRCRSRQSIWQDRPDEPLIPLEADLAPPLRRKILNIYSADIELYCYGSERCCENAR